MRLAGLLAFFSGICIPSLLPAQQIEKIWFNENDKVYGYYSVIKPVSNRIQGALVLLDGFGGNASEFLAETKLHNVAGANDLLTVCIPTGMRLYADSSMINLLNTILRQVTDTYHIRKDQFALGGFSSGGTIVLRYAELCKEKPAAYPVQPQAVFTVDSPVDVAGLYYSSRRDLQKKLQDWWLAEPQWIIDTYNKELGNPDVSLEKYRQVSPILTSDTTAGNERFLKDVAYRTYHDADVSWFIQNRKRSLYETNMLNASELVNRLVLMGNTRAEFMQSAWPGRRSNGNRHPHSWNIVDEIEAVQWIKKQLHFFPDHLEKPYGYTAPEGWSPEIILFPFGFAPELLYKGFEELRFAPGWGDAKSEQRWAYTILWWLNDRYQFTEEVLAKNLEAYFTGLTRQRAEADQLNMDAFSPARATVKKIATGKKDLATYTATISLFDAQVTKKPGKLYVKIHITDCPDKTRTYVFFEIAALPFEQGIWQQLDKVYEDFACESH